MYLSSPGESTGQMETGLYSALMAVAIVSTYYLSYILSY
jgi:hypothetical protein